MPTQACPLCDRPANYAAVNAPEGKVFACPSCTDFFIDESSEDYVAELPEVTRTEVRARLQKSARQSNASTLFVIRSPRPDERGGDGYKVAKKTLTTEFVSRG